MSGGTVCKCDPKRWAVIQRKCNHSAFNGYHRTPSDYSTVVCLDCGRPWRTKAKYVDKLPDMPEGWQKFHPPWTAIAEKLYPTPPASEPMPAAEHRTTEQHRGVLPLEDATPPVELADNVMQSRKWVKIKGSDVRLEYPSKKVMEPDGYHYHFEDDRTVEPKRIKQQPRLLEDNGDGTYTSWSYTVWGPVGGSGSLKEGIEVVPLTTKADRREADRLDDMMQRGMARQLGLAGMMSGNQNLLAAAEESRRRIDEKNK